MPMISKVLNWINTATNKKIFLIICLLVVSLYGKSVFYQFVIDDTIQIAKNTNVQSLLNIPHLFVAGTFGPESSQFSYYRPLMMATYAILYSLSGGLAWSFHFLNILLHLTNAILLFLFLKKLFLFKKIKSAQLISFLATTIFIIHPVNVESVAYIAAQAELIWTCSTLLLFLVLISIVKENRLENKSVVYIFLLTLIAMLVKETAFILFPLSIMFIWLFAPKILSIRKFWLGLSLSILSYLLLRFVFTQINNSSLPTSPITHSDIFTRITTIPFVIFSYIRMFFYPKDLFFAQHQIVRSILDPQFYIYLPIVFLVITAFVAFAFVVKSRLYTFFLLWTVISFIPLLQIIPLDETVAEHWMYEPFIGLVGMVIIAFSYLLKRYKFSLKFIFLLTIIIYGFLYTRSWIRIENWQNEVTLFEHDIQYHQKECDLYISYGVALVEAKNFSKAKEELEKDLQICPQDNNVLNYLGITYASLEDYQKAETFFQKAIAQNQSYYPYRNLGRLYITEGKTNEAISILLEGKRNFPQQPEFDYFLGFAYYQKHNLDLAVTYLQDYYRANPSPDLLILIQNVQNGTAKLNL